MHDRTGSSCLHAYMDIPRKSELSRTCKAWPIWPPQVRSTPYLSLTAVSYLSRALMPDLLKSEPSSHAAHAPCSITQ